MQRFLAAVSVVLLFGAAASADEIKIKVIEPAGGATITRRQVTVIAHVDSGAKVVTAEVLHDAPDEEGVDPEKPTPLAPVKDAVGRYQATLDAPSSGKFTIRVRAVAAKGKVTKATVDLESKRGYTGGELMAPGSTVPALKGKTARGDEVALDGKDGPVLVHQYSAWDDCEAELRWLAALSKKYDKLTIVGVASVPPADLEKWTKYLEKHNVSWKNVVDDGSIAKALRFERETAGSQLDACMTYVVKDGKVEGGDLMAWDYVGKLEQTSTEEALAKLFP